MNIIQFWCAHSRLTWSKRKKMVLQKLISEVDSMSTILYDKNYLSRCPCHLCSQIMKKCVVSSKELNQVWRRQNHAFQRRRGGIEEGHYLKILINFTACSKTVAWVSYHLRQLFFLAMSVSETCFLQTCTFVLDSYSSLSYQSSEICWHRSFFCLSIG